MRGTAFASLTSTSEASPPPFFRSPGVRVFGRRQRVLFCLEPGDHSVGSSEHEPYLPNGKIYYKTAFMPKEENTSTSRAP